MENPQEDVDKAEENEIFNSKSEETIDDAAGEIQNKAEVKYATQTEQDLPAKNIEIKNKAEPVKKDLEVQKSEPIPILDVSSDDMDRKDPEDKVEASLTPKENHASPQSVKLEEEKISGNSAKVT